MRRRPPTLVGLLALSLLIPPAQAQDAGAPQGAGPALHLRFRRAPLPLPAHPALAPGGWLGPYLPPAVVAARWAERVRADLAPLGTLTRADPSLARDTVAGPPGLEPWSPLGPYADVGMELNVRFELKADRFQNLRCTAPDRQRALSGCEPGFPTISPNPQYGVRTSGVVAQRLHVNVDFNSEREFDANNNLQVWYEGLENEVLRRVEAGNVTFQTPGSRFISAAIPANNFGVQAVAQLGALELRGIYAQQKGNVVRDRVYTVGETTTQPLDRELRDLDYEQGRFFFAVDPATLPAFPALDVLEIDREVLPDSLRVGALRVYRVRALAPVSPGNPNIGGVRAVACGVGTRAVDCDVQRAGPFQWEILFEGRDYYVDPSGTWFALATRLDQADYLAVSYVTASGLDSVGTFPVAARADIAVVDTLRLVYDPKVGVTADAPSFRFEIRSAYRVGVGELERASVELLVTINQRERTLTGETYLGRLGLAAATDPNRFDHYNRLFPRERDPQQGAPLREQFIVFPHLTPFADSARLEPAERNDSLYRTPRPALAAQAPPSVFVLRVRASVSASADRTTLSLNAFEIREGSERIYLGSRLLTRGADYGIDYASGSVTFLNADSLFQGGPAQVRAQFEERAAFAVAPTAIYGLAARYDLGDRGQINVTGMFQNEQSAFTRPPLGFEPSSSFIGGVSTRLRFAPGWLTRAVDALPGTDTDAPSFINVAAELAVSKPSPNRFGQAYVEEFEGDAARFVPLDEARWRWGSLPCGDPRLACTEGSRGAEGFGILGAFDTTGAAALVWQNLPLDADGRAMQFFPQQIDPTIRIAGQTQAAERVLWLTLHPDTVLGLANARTGEPNWTRPAGDASRWRALTLTLSETGIDLSRVEFLEFWVWEDNHRTARANGAGILFDFGSVFEDAVAFEPESFRVQGGDTTYVGARLGGLGRLDTEHDPLTRSWNAAINDVGLLTDRVTDGIVNLDTGERIDTAFALCSATRDGVLQQYRLGDLRARCGRNNGAADGEDQDRDFVLDSLAGVRLREDFVRYVFPVGDPGYYVRDGGMVPVQDSSGNPDGASGWRLYRIPFRSDSVHVGQPNLRQVQALRVTIVAPETTPGAADPPISFALARVRLVGSTWLKRAETPIRGVAGDLGTGVGAVVASVISTENSDLGYTPPPGVRDEADRRDAGLQLGGTQINEQSLRLLATGLRAGEHAEAFLRFTAAGDKNFLKYRELRVWARGRGAGWDDGDLEFYIKVGKDPHNFYLYRAPARTSSWEPEVVVAFDRWLTLRARLEQAWLRGDTAQIYPGCPDTTLVPHDRSYVLCDGPYLLHVRDPGTAPPNLAAVQELATGIFRTAESGLVGQAELWVDDIRLAGVVQDAGLAGALDVSLRAANLADVTLSLFRRDGDFRQLGDDPTYVTDNAATAAATLRLERFLPASWGVVAPLTVRHGVSASDPLYLSRTDLRADALTGVRTPRSRTTSYAVSLRRTHRSAGTLGRWLIDPLGLSGSFATGTARSDLSSARSSSYAVNVDYSLAPGALRWGGVRLNPASIRFRSTFSGSTARRSTFAVPVARASDSLVVPLTSRARVWRNSAGVDLLPLNGLRLRADLSSQRDLRDYGDSTTVGRLLGESRTSLLGQDIGVETQRTLSALVSATPRVGDWVRPRFTLTSGFTLTRDPNVRHALREDGDTAGAFRLPVAFGNRQRIELATQVDVRRLGQVLLPDSGVPARLLARVASVDVSYARTVASSFPRAPFTPSLAYQLALGGVDRFRREQGVLAVSASETTTLGLQSGVALPLGLRVNASYQEGTGVSWILRNAAQVPVQTESRDWPVLAATWSLSPGRLAFGRVVSNLTARLGYREREAGSEQRGVAPAGAPTLSRTTERSLTPSLTITWAGGILTTFDAAYARNDRLAAGNLFRTTRDTWNAMVSFTFRPPAALGRLPTGIRANARYGYNQNVICLRPVGGDQCVPHVDSRQTQAQLTLDTDFPPNISAGFQMAYVLNDERQANRKSSQLVITAFVNLTSTMGRLR